MFSLSYLVLINSHENLKDAEWYTIVRSIGFGRVLVQ